jgi:DNA-binding winged helix-turn-helix (wHTH) protein
LPSRTVSFGSFEFDPLSQQLRRHGTPIKLDLQAGALLALLVEKPGELHSYQEIQARLWGDTVVEYNKGIRRCLTQVRGALNDNAKAPVYIQTERNRGCRFIAPVRMHVEKPDSAEDHAGAPRPAMVTGQNSPDREQPQQSVDTVAPPVGQAGHLGVPLWVLRCLLWGITAAIFAVLVVAILTSAYGLAIFAFWLGAGFVILGYLDSEDHPMSRAIVAIYMILAMSYTATASTMPAFRATIINVKTLAPSAAFLFVIGLKFIPLMILVLAYWVILRHYGDAGFLARPRLGKAYVLLGGLFLSATLICVAWTSGDDHVWRAGLPGRWSLMTGAAVVLAANLAVWFVGHWCFRRARISSYRPLFWLCTAAYLPIALGAFFIDDEHNRINQYNLDLRWPQAYVAANPDAINEFDGPRQELFESQVGLDLRNLLHDTGFRDALRNGIFYRQHYDELFQVSGRAVMYGYRPRSSYPQGRSSFVVVRFPQELADAFRFQPVGDAN